LQANGYRFQWIGYRLDDGGRYRAIEPDAEGRIVSETTGLAFGVSSNGQTVMVFDARTGERLYTSSERAAQTEERAAREAEARKDAEDEVTRLREEIARLKGTAG
jgi:hypothetical protein